MIELNNPTQSKRQERSVTRFSRSLGDADDLSRRTVAAQKSLLAFALLWLFELYWMQSATLITNHSGGPQFDYWAPKIRFVVDGLFVASLVCMLRVRWLACLVLIGLPLNLVLIAYANYFQCPLTMSTILTAYREGAAVSWFAFDWIPLWPALGLFAVCAVKLLLLWQARAWQVPHRTRLIVGAIPISGFIALYAVALWLDPLNAILAKRGVARLGIIRGYAGPWLAELYYTGDPRVTQVAIERAEARSDQLTPEEATIPIHKRLAIIQVESLDYNVLGHQVDGKEVTPFLNRLHDEAMFYRAQAYHVLGSADADFTMLMGGKPAMNAINYSLRDFPYEHSLPHLLAKHGFQSVAFHGNNGTFYNRRPPFEAMGFSKIFFREELDRMGSFTSDTMGLRDADVLGFSAHLLRESTAPTCHFIITLTSHSPYRFIRPDRNSLIPKPRDVVDRYFNHIHYTDACLRDYISSLGKGATVVIYADHPTEVERSDFANARTSSGKFVPVFIYDTDQNLAKLQRTRGEAALSGKFTMVDISNYLRSQIAQSWPVVDGKPVTSK